MHWESSDFMYIKEESQDGKRASLARLLIQKKRDGGVERKGGRASFEI